MLKKIDFFLYTFIRELIFCLCVKDIYHKKNAGRGSVEGCTFAGII